MELILVDKTSDIQVLRQKYQSGYFNKRYIGWSDDFDKEYDPHLQWYALKDHSAFCRVSYKKSGVHIPIEKADGSSQCILSTSNCCEINNFMFYEREAGITLIQRVLEKLSAKSLAYIYCIVDENHKSAYQLNTEVFGFKDTGKTVQYSDILSRKNKQVVKWLTLEKHKSDERVFTHTVKA